MNERETAARPGLTVRAATAADLPALAGLLARPGAAEPAPLLPQQAHELLLVAEEQSEAGGRLLACARLRPAVGLTLPRAWYHVGCVVHAAPDLQLFQRQRTLMLGNDHTGASELSDLAELSAATDGVPLADRAAALRLLLRSMLLAMARQRDAYAPQLIVELPGPRDGAGQSPFWQGLGRHFYATDPQLAQRQFGDAWRSHVAKLLPRHPIYASFLPPAAQAAVAQVGPEARLRRELLEEAGLRYGHHVCIDDAGPVLEADLDALPALTSGRVYSVVAAATADFDAAEACLVLTGEGAQLRAARVTARVGSQTLALAAPALRALGLHPGDSVWASSFRHD
jgi:arginine N-succinyltransferase